MPISNISLLYIDENNEEYTFHLDSGDIEFEDLIKIKIGTMVEGVLFKAYSYRKDRYIIGKTYHSDTDTFTETLFIDS